MYKQPNQKMLDIEDSEKICSNCKRFLGKHKFDLNGFCEKHLLPVKFSDNCLSLGKKNKFKEKKR